MCIFIMVPEEKIEEIRKEVMVAENPLILFDDDMDGLCSYLTIRRIMKNVTGIPIKSGPIVDVNFVEKVKDISPDLIVILDKPIVTQEFIDKANTNIVWIDHHPALERKRVNYLNPLIWDNKDNRPTTYWCYNVAKLKDSLWIATAGCVADHFIPDFFDEFVKKYPDLVNKKEIEDLKFNSKLGELIKIFDFVLKGKSNDVKNSISKLEKIKEPYEILNKTSENGKFIFDRAEKINKQYKSLLNKALEEKSEDGIFLFVYPGSKMSFTNSLAGELLYRFPDKIVIVGRERGDKIKLSFRGKHIKIRPILEEALKGIEGYGGGHEYACGGQVAKKDFNKFINNIKRLSKRSF